MNKYFKTDFKRALSRRNTEIGLLIAVAFVVIVNILLFRSLGGQNNLLSPGQQAMGYTPSELLIIIANQAVVTMLPYVAFIVSSIFYVEEKKERGMLRAVECGISKEAIAISKFIESIIFCIIFAIAIFGLHVLIVKILYGLDGNSVKYIIDLINSIAILSLPMISGIAFMNLLALQISGEFVWSAITIIYTVFLDSIVKYLGMILRSQIIMEISTYMPSSAFKIASSLVTLSGTASLSFADFRVQIILSVFFIILFMALSIYLMRTRDLD